LKIPVWAAIRSEAQRTIPRMPLRYRLVGRSTAAMLARARLGYISSCENTTAPGPGALSSAPFVRTESVFLVLQEALPRPRNAPCGSSVRSRGVWELVPHECGIAAPARLV
jgi:hypothetical protein